ncbi:cupredoxin domain-containing protein [Bacillus sp. JJ1764]|uniref:cupredoxin domain-containing protein n=1 Tax=Bacillus sp. JJ1764 TaxID=3122964 RepID=UPI002FFFD732
MMIFSVLSTVIVAISTGYSIVLLYRNKTKISKTPGLMIAIGIACMAGLLSGTIIGMVSGEMFLVVGVSMIIGFMIGFLSGHPIGLLAIIMSSISGLFGGMVGAVLGVFLQFITPTILLGILLGIYVIISGLIILFILSETKDQFTVQTEEISPFAIISAGVIFVSLFLFLYSSNLVNIPNKAGSTASAQTSEKNTMVKTVDKTEVDVSEESTPKVKMLVTEKGYSPATIRVKKGVPVELEIQNPLENSCLSIFNIPDFHINNAKLNVGMTKLTFTPDETGQHTFSCGMNMYKGTIIVK